MVLFENEKIIAAVLAFVCFAAAIYILTSRKSIIKKKADYKMYGCKMIYADSSMGVEDDSVEKGRILYSRKLDIQGKPDFLFECHDSNLPDPDAGISFAAHWAL